MTEENYRRALHDAMHEADSLLTKRKEIDQRLLQLRATVNVLSGLLTPSPTTDEESTEIGDLGISEAIRAVLKDSSGALTPADVKLKLIEAKFDLDKYRNSSAVIHNTLKRLEAQSEVIPVRTLGGVAAYTLAPVSQLASHLAERTAQQLLKTMDDVRENASRQIKATEKTLVDAQAMAMGGMERPPRPPRHWAHRIVVEKKGGSE